MYYMNKIRPKIQDNEGYFWFIVKEERSWYDWVLKIYKTKFPKMTIKKYIKLKERWINNLLNVFDQARDDYKNNRPNNLFSQEVQQTWKCQWGRYNEKINFKIVNYN